MKIDLNLAKPCQKLKGWGTSACWWAQAVNDDETGDELAELFYGDSGLELNIYRYNIGAGFDEELNRVEDPWRRTESFLRYDRESEESAFDFSKDKNAIGVMKKCLEKGNIDTLIFFCNSPHYSFTSSGQASGSLLGHTCNLPMMNYKKFVDYTLDVVEHFLNEGYPVKYLSPINEPQWKWGGSTVWQEGCHYETCEIVEIFRLFAQEILRRKLPVYLYGLESGAMLENTPEYLEALSGDETIRKVLKVFAYHSYHSDDKPQDRYEFKEKLVKTHPEFRFDMSEWCELPNKCHTKDFKAALITARIIGQDLAYGRAESWTSWVAVNTVAIKEDGFDYCDAFVSASADFSRYSICERYYAMAHYSKFIPAGSTVLDIGLRPSNDKNDFNVFAFGLENGKKVLIIVNEGKDKKINLCGDFKEMKIILSDRDRKLEKIYGSDFKSEIECPSNSLITTVIK